MENININKSNATSSSGGDGATTSTQPSAISKTIDEQTEFTLREYIPEDECSDSEIDITNKRFNPLKALYSKKLILPTNDYTIYNNINEFEVKILSTGWGLNNVNISKNNNNNSNSKRKKELETETLPLPERRFLPEQGLVKGPGIKLRHKRNILLQMEKGYQGPLNAIIKCMKNRLRVKINTRTNKGTLGYVTGFIEVLDKHWNLVISNAYEVWKRKKYSFCYVAGVPPQSPSPSSVQPQSSQSSLQSSLIIQTNNEFCLSRLKSLNLKLPDVKVKSIHRKYVQCSRHISQLVIRGEHIISIILDVDVNGNVLGDASKK